MKPGSLLHRDQNVKERPPVGCERRKLDRRLRPRARLIRVACTSFVSAASPAAASLTILPSWLHLGRNQPRLSVGGTTALDGWVCDVRIKQR
jgi:hypothetical protein